MKHLVRLFVAGMVASPLFVSAQPFFTYPVTLNGKGYYTGNMTTSSNGTEKVTSPQYKVTTVDLIKILCQELGLAYNNSAKLTAEYGAGNTFLWFVLTHNDTKYYLDDEIRFMQTFAGQNLQADIEDGSSNTVTIGVPQGTADNYVYNPNTMFYNSNNYRQLQFLNIDTNGQAGGTDEILNLSLYLMMESKGKSFVYPANGKPYMFPMDWNCTSGVGSAECPTIIGKAGDFPLTGTFRVGSGKLLQ